MSPFPFCIFLLGLVFPTLVRSGGALFKGECDEAFAFLSKSAPVDAATGGAAVPLGWCKNYHVEDDYVCDLNTCYGSPVCPPCNVITTDPVTHNVTILNTTTPSNLVCNFIYGLTTNSFVCIDVNGTAALCKTTDCAGFTTCGSCAISPKNGTAGVIDGQGAGSTPPVTPDSAPTTPSKPVEQQPNAPPPTQPKKVHNDGP
ncbi:hypothetical protein O181_001088 [Austropuccinia psidii MF-1]|uniref:Secreted protein n=1 Tax=Austropuccinia psidii MF-1 TaxID=1389203 RepID=A0A9Q3B9T9_9BASI|nr:hypothetical protein [Austropuccinia psidii MF-1]